MTSGNAYVLQVKGNQPTLLAQLQALHHANPVPAGATHQQQERRRGQQLSWQTSVYAAPAAAQAGWAGLAQVAVVVKTVKQAGTTTCTTRYYITSLTQATAAELAQGIRGHWGIENKLHRTRDVQFGQDANRIRGLKAAVNVSIFNTLALNFLLTRVHLSVSLAQLFFAQNFRDFLPPA